MVDHGPFDALREVQIGGEHSRMADLTALEDAGLCDLDSLPVNIRVLLEPVLGNADGETTTEDDVRNVGAGDPTCRTSNSRSSPRTWCSRC